MALRKGSPLVALAVTALILTAYAVPQANANGSLSTARPAATTSSAGPADEVVAGSDSADGYRLFVAGSADGWAWQPLALLDPAGASDQSWIGTTCVTGDGRSAVAVVASWSAVNSPAGIAAGGIAYGVNLATGRTRVLADDVSAAYFNPGCGSGGDVALTSYAGDSEQATRVQRIDAASGTVEQTAVLPGEATSAVPVSGTIVAARGAALVRVDATGTTTLATLPGQAYDLRPNGQGGLDALSADSTSSGSAWRVAVHELRRLGTGPLGRLSLTAGRAGATTLTGATATATAAGLTTRGGDGALVLGSSQLGSAVLTAPPKSDGRNAAALPQIVSASGKVLRAATAAPAAAVPRTVATTVGAVTPAPATAPSGSARHAAVATAAAQTPACAVGRDDPTIQVPQPSNDQVDWAIEQAVNNALPARPTGFDNLPGGGYSPEADFAQPALSGGGGSHVPAMVVAGVLAQESNFNQASWHAPAGTAGDPLIADYYGNGGSSTSIDYASADCGYGLGQITDIMNAGNSIGTTIQDRVAVDYAENVAAVVQHLAATWNTLAGDGITINTGDPSWLENWYATLWAYNSGIEPKDASLGLPSGCSAPGPGCTDSAGNWGLGWANNPINPVFEPGRPVYLADSYADAATPGKWPYQERVFGWMATALQRYDTAAGATVAAYPVVAHYLQVPPESAFCTSVDNCNPNDASKLYCGYQSSGSLQYHCWWHGGVAFAASCTGAVVCERDIVVYTPGAAEPKAVDPDPPACSLNTSQVPASTSAGSTILVTEESGPANPSGADIDVVGCTGGNWTAAGTFSVAYAQDSQGDPLGQVDFHQLGGGFGGHMYFTHTVPTSSATTNQVTGTWSPGLSTSGVYQVMVFVPNLGADANPANYTISTTTGQVERTLDQNAYGNQWVSLGVFALGAGAAVSLTNVTPNGNGTSDLAFNAVAFVPRPGRLVHHTIDGFSNFGQNQSLSGSPGAWIEGDFASDSTLIQMANNLTGGLLAYPACAGTATSTSCVPQPVLTAMTTWRSTVAADGNYPVRWLAFSRAAPPNPLPTSYLATGTNYKIRASVNIDFVVLPSGQIDPSSYTVTATNATGITEIPQFIRDMFTSIASGYGIALPNLTYSATNLEYFNGANIAVDPLGTGLAPGREYKPDLSVQLTANNTCLQVQDLAGGSIGWKTLLTDDNVVTNAAAWKGEVDAAVAAGHAPQALSALADTVITDFFARPLQWNVVPWPGNGSLFYYAPPIWVETHVDDCVSGTTDTITPAGSVDPTTNKAQLIDNSYMPDLYLSIDGTYVDAYGTPTNGGPVQTGDWPDFAASPTSVYPTPSPWNACYIGPTVTTTAGTIDFISRRDGNPWSLPMLDPTNLSSTVSFC